MTHVHVVRKADNEDCADDLVISFSILISIMAAPVPSLLAALSM
jgi:hypothetical protein